MERTGTFSGELNEIRKQTFELFGLVPTRQRWTLGGAALLTILGGICGTAIPLLLGRLVDVVQAGAGGAEGSAAVASGRLPSGAILYLSLMGAAYCLREGLQLGRRLLVEETCTRLDKHLTVELVSHVMMLDLSTLAREKVGSLHGKLIRSVSGSIRFLRVVFLDFLPAIIAGGLALAAATAKQPLLGLVLCLMIPVIFLVTWRQLISQKGVRLKLLETREEIDGTLVEQLTGIEYIRAANTHAQETRRIDRSAEFLRRKELKHHFVMSIFGSGKALVESLCHLAVLGLAVYFVSHGRGTVGDIPTFSMLFLGVMAPLAEVHRIIDEGHESSLLVGELLNLLHQPVDPGFQTKEEKPPEINGEALIHVDDLHVRCTSPEGQEKSILSGVSLEVRKGEIVGIAGRSGCGKSTLLRALMRLVPSSEGRAILGGTPLDAVSRESLARLLGYVSQTPFVFAGTVEQNIAYECEGATFEDIRRAAEAACLHQEIMQFADGYKSRLGERGQNLSGGQRQRLALARVILKNPPILILDEATSALDTINEAHIQEWLNAERGRRTILMVAHRLSTLRHSDRIVVFDEGRIVEAGPYDELIQRGGLFSELNDLSDVASPVRA